MTERETGGGQRGGSPSTLLAFAVPGYTLGCQALHHPYLGPVGVLWTSRRGNVRGEGGRREDREAVHRLFNATFTGERASRRGTSGIGRSRGRAGGGVPVSKGVSLFRSGSESYITRADAVQYGLTIGRISARERGARSRNESIIFYRVRRRRCTRSPRPVMRRLTDLSIPDLSIPLLSHRLLRKRLVKRSRSRAPSANSARCRRDKRAPRLNLFED